MNTRTYLSPKGAASEMGVSVATIRAAIANGRLRARKTGDGGGGLIRIKRADLDEWFDQMAEA